MGGVRTLPPPQLEPGTPKNKTSKNFRKKPNSRPQSCPAQPYFRPIFCSFSPHFSTSGSKKSVPSRRPSGKQSSFVGSHGLPVHRGRGGPNPAWGQELEDHAAGQPQLGPLALAAQGHWVRAGRPGPGAGGAPPQSTPPLRLPATPANSVGGRPSPAPAPVRGEPPTLSCCFFPRAKMFRLSRRFGSSCEDFPRCCHLGS